MKRVGGTHGSLEGIQEADAEVILVALGYVGVGGRNSDRGNLGFSKNRSAGHRQRTAPGSDDRLHFFLLHQNRRRIRRFHLVGLVVYHDQLNRLAKHFRKKLVRQLDTIIFVGAAGAIGRP